MSSEVIAFPRRDRIVLGTVVGEGPILGGEIRLMVLAEDGARFALPAEQVIARFPGLLDTVPAAPQPQRFAALRGRAERKVAWAEIAAGAEAGTVLTFADLARLAGASTEAERLGVALAAGSAEPWLRRSGGTWTVVPHDEARARLAAAEAARRAEREDGALKAWWPNRATSPMPPACAGAVDALRAFGVRGDAPATERGRVLASQIDLPEPDQVVEALVESGLLPPTTDPSLWRAGLAEGFSAAATEEAARAAGVSPSPARREDFTALHTVAVDDAETTEVDDALSVRRTEAGLEVFVHIADVAASVPAGGPLDDALRARAGTLYVPDGNVTMMPEALVRGRVSLDPGVVREAVTGVFVVRGDGSLASSRFVRSLIRVTRRLTYDATADVATLAATPDDARALVAAAESLRAARVAAGAVVSNLPSLKVKLADGAPVLELRTQTTPGDSVVAELAVLCNAEAGRLLAARDVPAFFRVQDPPRGSAPDPSDPLAPVLARRRFAPTHLRVEPGRHHGVGCDAYAQVTSPMRRFADLVNQRQLVAVVAGEPAPYRPADLETLAEHVSQRERAVRRASDDRARTWIALDVRRRGVRTFDGLLVKAPRRGLGSVWVEDLLMELPLRAPDRWKAPPEGTRATWRVARIAPWRGRIELEPGTEQTP